jgi:hypothetical protein
VSPSASPSPSPTPPPRPATVYDGPAATTPAEAVAYAQDFGVGPGPFTRVAVALLDRQTGAVYEAGDVDGYFRSASLVKNFIAARMLVEEQPFDAATEDLMWRMITCSDDGAASTLWRRLGGAAIIDWAADRYDLGDLIGPPPPDRPNSWGLTNVSARGLVTFYDAVTDDPVVGEWLLDAMGNATRSGCDDYYQHFGLPSATDSWRVKQGWIHNHNGRCLLHSTGFVDDDRYIAVLLTEGPSSLYDGTGRGSGRYTVTGMAEALLPGGHVPNDDGAGTAARWSRPGPATTVAEP